MRDSKAWDQDLEAPNQFLSVKTDSPFKQGKATLYVLHTLNNMEIQGDLVDLGVK